MKTRNSLRKKDHRISFLVMSLMVVYTVCTNAQDPGYNKTLFRPDLGVEQVWSPEIKINTIQGKTGALIGLNGGVVFDRHLFLGIAGGVNLTHPTVNYGYFGGIAKYIFNPASAVHFSGQLLIGYGSTKDYECPKSGLMDNFWNISGELFLITEPGINLEFNLTDRVTFITGISYRSVSGIDPGNENVSRTRLTNQDMNGFNLNFGLRFRKK